ncbi:hypothetical protein MMC13_005294 [Lambiella insularis]|nr:hypothetical protein [Lambiella insularis]
MNAESSVVEGKNASRQSRKTFKTYHTRSMTLSSEQNSPKNKDCYERHLPQISTPHPTSRTMVSVAIKKQDVSATPQVIQRPEQRQQSFPQNRSRRSQDLTKLLTASQDRNLFLGTVLTQERAKSVRLAESNRLAQDKVLGLQETCAALQQELQSCKRDLFSLQPCKQVSDAEIADQVENLSQRITQWVDDVFKEINRLACEHSPASKANGDTVLVASSADAESNQILRDIASAAEFFMQHTIFQHLQERLFPPDCYLVGLQPGIESMLQEIESSMGLLEPKRGMSIGNL